MALRIDLEVNMGICSLFVSSLLEPSLVRHHHWLDSRGIMARPSNAPPDTPRASHDEPPASLHGQMNRPYSLFREHERVAHVQSYDVFKKLPISPVRVFFSCMNRHLPTDIQSNRHLTLSHSHTYIAIHLAAILQASPTCLTTASAASLPTPTASTWATSTSATFVAGTTTRALFAVFDGQTQESRRSRRSLGRRPRRARRRAPEGSRAESGVTVQSPTNNAATSSHAS